MTTAEMINEVKVYVKNDKRATDAVVTMYLSRAAAVILSLLYRAHGSIPSGAKVPLIYQHDQCELASRYFLRMGAEGEISHNENGISRTWGSVDDADILKRIMPFAYIPNGRNGQGGTWV